MADPQNPGPPIDPFGTPEAIRAAQARQRTARLASGTATLQLWLWLAPIIAIVAFVIYVFVT